MPRAARVTSDGLTLKEERFCDAFLATGDATSSYRRAYSASTRRSSGWVRREAHRVLHRPHIRLRIEVLRQKAEELAIYSANQAMREAGKAFELAERTLQPAAMVSAVALRARLAGLLMDR